ncbi:hypothetical protein Tco_1357492 [Tanacetum coccineum]
MDFAKPVKAIYLPQDVPSISDCRLIELENQVQRLMEAHLAPKSSVQVNKITSSCEICIGSYDTQYCMENHEQAFVDYASSHIDEAGGKWYTFKPEQNNLGDTIICHVKVIQSLGLVSSFMASQDARLSKFEANFKQQQGEMTNKIDTVLKAVNDRITGALLSDAVKNPKLNVNPTSLVLPAPSNLQKDQLQMVNEIRTSKPKEPAKALEEEFKDLYLNLPVLKVLAHALIYNAMLDKYVESLELVKNESAFIQGKMPKKMKDPGLFTFLCSLGDSKPFDTLADLGSCVNLIPLYLFKRLKIRLLEETDHGFGLADGTKQSHICVELSILATTLNRLERSILNWDLQVVSELVEKL